jgi:hypothetical protein
LKTDALPGVAAVVVVARHPAQAGVVSAEFGERRRAGNRICQVVVAALGTRDGVPANRAGATLKPNDLALKAIIARQDDPATVREERSAILSCEEANATKILRQDMSKSFAADAVIVLADKPNFRGYSTIPFPHELQCEFSQRARPITRTQRL